MALVEAMFDPIAPVRQSLNIAKVRSQLDIAKANWAAVGVDDYSFDIHGRSQSICEVDAHIQVEDNVVMEVRDLSSASLLPPKQWADPDWGNEVFLCDYNHFTVPQMFDMLGKTLKNSPFAVLEAEFNPQYGFMTRFEDGIFASHGWLNLRDQNVYNKFQISNFKIEQ